MSTEQHKSKKPSLKRRRFLQQTSAGAVALAPGLGLTQGGLTQGAQVTAPDSWRTPGKAFSNYGQPLDTEGMPIRWISADQASPGTGVSWCPLHELAGTITPNGLHFERHHNGIPELNVTTWTLSISGEVERVLQFNRPSLERYPMMSRILFIECGGNSNAMWYPDPVQAPVGYLHGLISCSEWSGIKISSLLDEAGIKSNAQWLIVDAYDAAGVAVSLPLSKVMDDCFIALYQNGEPIRAANGYPARLIVPGWEGITHIKWLRNLYLAETPAMTRFDTVSYTDLKADGRAERFSYPMSVKSVITSPTVGKPLDSVGFHEIRGLAWTGNGSITRVEISVDGGASWQDAQLQKPVLPQSLTRFRFAWSWNGEARTLMSRAHDSSGVRQPGHTELIDTKGLNHYYHYNAVCALRVDEQGRIENVRV